MVGQSGWNGSRFALLTASRRMRPERTCGATDDTASRCTTRKGRGGDARRRRRALEEELRFAAAARVKPRHASGKIEAGFRLQA
jgi:hypothetical protein